MEPGDYYFDAEGKLVMPEEPEVPFTGIKGGYYYENGEVKGDAGLVELDGSYYYVVFSGKIKTDCIYKVTEAKSNGYVEPGNYYFDAEGKLVR